MKGLGQVPDIGGDGAAWFCAIVAPNQHGRAEGELYRLGYRTYIPQLRKWISHARQKRAVYKPLLGRYAFVEIAAERQGFDQVRSVTGIEDLVRTGLEPVRVPSAQVESLMRRQISGEFDFTAHRDIPVGALVRIVEGQFENALAVLTRRRKGKVEVKLAGSPVSRTVYPMQIRPAA